MKKATLKKKPSFFGLIFAGFLWIYSAISLYPLIWMMSNSLKTNEEIFVTNPFGFPSSFVFENYVSALNQYNVPLYFFNSVFVSVFTVVLTISFALLFSYATTRMRWKGKVFTRNLVALGLFIPVQAILIPITKVIQGIGLFGTRFSLILPYTAINLAFATMVYYGFFKSIPIEMEEAACIDGANVYQTFFKIIIPCVKPATVTLVIYIFLNAWNEFLLANVLVGTVNNLKTLPLGILFFQGQFSTNYGAMAATMTIASIPAVVVYCLFSEQVERAMTIGGAVKG